MSMYGTVGRLGVATRPMATNQAIAWLEIREDDVDPPFMFGWLSNHAAQFDQQARGATQRNINREIIKVTGINLPPLDEQRRIGELMAVVDGEVDTSEIVAADARTLRTALLTDLLSGTHEIPASYDRFLEAA